MRPMFRTAPWTALVALASCLGACDPKPPVPDAPALDAFERPDSPLVLPDVPPPVCAAPCGSAETCCDVAGAPTCVVTGNDVTNCGDCGNDCLATDRGDACALGECTCGDIDIGCLGGLRSTCCLGSADTGRCADLLADFDDCGGCDARCDAETADHCQAGTC